jgi:hypothetical protein
MKTGDWLKTHKQEAALGGAGLVVAIALYVRSKNASSSSGTTTASTGNPATVDDTTATDYYSGLENQITGLQSALLGAGTQAPYSPPTNESISGSGYGLPGGAGDVTSASGATFEELANWNAAQAIISGGGTVDYEPSPGIFAPANKGGQLLLAPGSKTPLFVSQQQST